MSGYVYAVGCSVAPSEDGRGRGRLVRVGLPGGAKPPTNTAAPLVACPYCSPPHLLGGGPLMARPRRKGEPVDVELSAEQWDEAKRARLRRRDSRRYAAS